MKTIDRILDIAWMIACSSAVIMIVIMLGVLANK